MLDEPLDPPRAKQLIREILEDGSVSFSGHAERELAKDNLTAVDATNVLRGGVVEPGEFENGSWPVPRSDPADLRRRRVPLRIRASCRDRVEVEAMKCEQCGSPVTVSHENYSYTASGLPNVTLVGVEIRRCAECGEHEVVIPKIEKLHRAIALAIVGKKTRLTAEEIRFLRKYLGWSGADFARHIGVTPESISRWENEKERMNPVADRLLRLMVVTKTPVADYSLDALADLQDKSTPTRMKLYASPKDWRAEVAA